MRKLTTAAAVIGSTTLAAMVTAGIRRRQHLTNLDTELVQRLRDLNPESLNDSTSLTQIASKHNLTELTDGDHFRRTITNEDSRTMLVDAFAEIRAKETDGAVEGDLSQFERDYLVHGLPRAVRLAANRRRPRRETTHPLPDDTSADSTTS